MFTERELFLMKETLTAGRYYNSVAEWLDIIITEDGATVGMSLNHDAPASNNEVVRLQTSLQHIKKHCELMDGSPCKWITWRIADRALNNGESNE